MSAGRPPLPEGPYLVVGLARSGLAAARMLEPHGRVIACDSGTPEVPDSLQPHLGTSGVELLGAVRCVVKSPGVPREAPVVAAALERGIPVHGELELAWRLLPNRFVAVTGTNGKTTTVELLGEVFHAAGTPVTVAGNVGTPLSSQVGSLPRDAVVVCEVSSFQLEDATAFAPDTALLLNLEEDHLDRHGTFERYRDAKLRVFARQDAGDVAVAPLGRAVPGTARRVTFGGPGADVAVEDGSITWAGRPFLAVSALRLRGAHNLENAMGAAATALASGVPEEAVRQALRTFAGVAHRLEEVGTVNGVLFVNDSKATNVAAARRGIEAFPDGVHVILGGSPKGGGFGGLREAVAGRCRAAYLIGQAAEELERDLEGTARLRRCGDLRAAVEAATEAAQPGEVVLLSPACASYDQFKDYEERGELFRRLLPAA